jgi:hypothetical protein
VETREAAVLQGLDERHARNSEPPGLGALYRAILDRSASRKEKGLAEIDTMMAQARKDEPFHHRQAVEARRELQAFENISFARYVLSVFTAASGA